MMTETRLPPLGDDAAELRRLRIQNRLELERAKAKRIEHLKRVQEVRQTNEWAMAHAPAKARQDVPLMESTFQTDYVSAYADWLDRFRNNEVSLFQISSPTDRRLGSFFPFFRNENELSLLRMPSRIVATTNNYAIGMLGGLSSFVVADGFSYSCKAKRKDCPQELVDYCQDVIEAFQARNQWHGGEQPGMEEDAFSRSETDGEFLLFNEADSEGRAWTYTVEPEQLVQPPSESIEEWSFGIMANPSNPQVHEAYWIRGSNVPDGEEYTTDEIVHFRANVPRSVKRGLPSFSFSTYDTFNIADKLRRGVGMGAAIQSCIAWVRKHNAASSSQVDAYQQQLAQFEQTNQTTGVVERTQKFSPGEILDVDENQEYIPPPSAANGQAHIGVLQMLLRGASTRWNAPEWIASADASNNNFASSLVAESPFVRRIQGRQRGIGEAFRRCHEYALKAHLEHRGSVTLRVKEGERVTEKTFTWKDVLRLVEIQVEGVSPVVTDKASEAQRFSTEHQAGVLSVKTWQMQAGYDPDTEEANNREWDEAHAPQPGAGLEAMFGGLGGGGEGDKKPKPPTMESLLESEEEDDDTDPERIELIADILEHVFGDKALELFDEKAVQESLMPLDEGLVVLLEWAETDHPRGKGGKFIPKNSAEAQAAAKESIKETLKGPKTAESHQKLVEHLNILSVKQLHALKKEYGISASGPNAAALREKLAERLGKARSEDGPKPTGEEPGYKEWAKGEREKNKVKGEKEPPTGADQAATSEAVLKTIQGLNSPVVDLAELRKQMPENMRGKEFDAAVLAMADDGKLSVSQDSDPGRWSDEEKASYAGKMETGKGKAEKPKENPASKAKSPVGGLNPKDNESVVKNAASTAFSRMTAAEKGAIGDYTTGMSVDVNQAIRSGTLDLDRDMRDLAKHMDSAFANTPKLSSPVTVHRGMSFDELSQYEDFVSQLQAGKEVTFPTFTSTSLDPNVSAGYLKSTKGSGTGVLLEIEADHGLYIEGRSYVPGSTGEKEFILPRNQSFRVTGTRKVEIGGETHEVYTLAQQGDRKSPKAESPSKAEPKAEPKQAATLSVDLSDADLDKLIDHANTSANAGDDAINKGHTDAATAGRLAPAAMMARGIRKGEQYAPEQILDSLSGLTMHADASKFSDQSIRAQHHAVAKELLAKVPDDALESFVSERGLSGYQGRSNTFDSRASAAPVIKDIMDRMGAKDRNPEASPTPKPSEPSPRTAKAEASPPAKKPATSVEETNTSLNALTEDSLKADGQHDFDEIDAKIDEYLGRHSVAELKAIAHEQGLAVLKPTKSGIIGQFKERLRRYRQLAQRVEFRPLK